MLILYSHKTVEKTGFHLTIPYAEHHVCLFCIAMKLSEKPQFHLTIPYAEYHMCLFCIITKLSEKAAFLPNYSICRVPYVLILYGHELSEKPHFHLTIPYAEYHICLIKVMKLSEKAAFSPNYSIC